MKRKTYKHLIGTKQGKLTIRAVHTQSNGKKSLVCDCDCGNKTEIALFKQTQSCGCLRKERVIAAHTTHGDSGSSEHKIWCAIKRRCYNKNSERYSDYGGRGITVSGEWLSDYSTFLVDMGRRPTLEHSIDRIDNNKGYSKENCRWANPKEQANNTRRNKIVEYKGRAMSVSLWANEFNLNSDTVLERLRKGWSVEKSLETRPNETKFNMKTWNGKTQTVTEWARELGINVKTVEDRFKRGYSTEKAFTKSSKQKTLTYKNETHTIKEWATITGINYTTILKRHNAGWEDSKCLNK